MHIKRDSKLIFIHIPKTAGSSFVSILKRNFKPNELFLATAGRLSNKEYYLNSLNEYLRLDQKTKNKIKVIRGHFTHDNNKLFDRDCTYITFLRNPIERYISEYYFIKGNPRNALHDICNQISLEEYILDDKYQFDNLQTRFVAGDLLSKADDSMLEIALQNLQANNFYFGITERFEESLKKMSKKFNWKIKNNPMIRFNNPRKQINELSITTISNIKKKNNIDFELYVNAIKIFDYNLLKNKNSKLNNLLSYFQ